MAEKKDDDFLIKAGLVAGLVFFVGKPLLNALSPFNAENKQAVDDVLSSPPDTNPFSMYFTPFVQLYTATLVGGQPRYTPDQAAVYWQQAKENWVNSGFDIDTYGITDTEYDIAYMAEKIYNAVGFWGTDESAVESTFHLAKSQVTIAAIDAYLQYNYGIDLMTFLDHGSKWIPFNLNGVPSGILKRIIDFVYALPVTVLGD